MNRFSVKPLLMLIGPFLFVQTFLINPSTFGQSNINTLTEGSISEESLPHPTTLKKRLLKVGATIEANDHLFDEVIYFLRQIQEEGNTNGPIANKTIKNLQETGYQSSVISTDVSLFRTVLDDTFPANLLALPPIGTIKIEQSLLPFEKSKIELQRAIHSLRAEISKLQTLTSLNTPRDFLPLHSTSDSYLKNQQDFLVQLKGLKSTILSFGARDAKHQIRATVYEFLDEDKRKGKPEGKKFGLLTYVLFVAPNIRNATFFRELGRSTPIGESYEEETKPFLHIFYVPVRNRIKASDYLEKQPQDSLALGSIRGRHSYYDFPFSLDFHVRYCASPTNQDTTPCRTSGQGPYLLTTTQPPNRLNTAPSPTLLLDLSHVHEEAFGEFIQAIKEQVMRPDFTDRRKLETLRLRLLSVILTAADVVVPIKNGVESILHLVSLTDRSIPSKSAP